jgi:hypothetical protein
MKDLDIQNATLDEFERKLFEALKLKDLQIEEIVASPQLYRSVLARIEEQKASSTRTTSAIGWQWNWRLSLAAYGLLALFLAGAIFASLNERRSPSAAKIPVHQEPDRIIKPFSDQSTSEVAVETPAKPERVAQPAVFKPRAKVSDHRRQPPIEEVSEFYPLTGGQDGNEDGGQLVRVDLPRSALVAMGVDVPFDNSVSKVKTDILIGSDGVMRAVRFVK